MPQYLRTSELQINKMERIKTEILKRCTLTVVVFLAYIRWCIPDNLDHSRQKSVKQETDGVSRARHKNANVRVYLVHLFSLSKGSRKRPTMHKSTTSMKYELR